MQRTLSDSQKSLVQSLDVQDTEINGIFAVNKIKTCDSLERGVLYIVHEFRHLQFTLDLSFLSQRHQSSKFSDVHGSMCNSPSGIPEDSILGPTPLACPVESSSESQNSAAVLYADDSTLLENTLYLQSTCIFKEEHYHRVTYN